MLNEKTRLLQIINELKADHQKLVKSHEDFRANAAKLSSLFESLHKQIKKTAMPTQRGSATPQLMNATREMQEMNMSFNLQYLQLQQKMQSDNRKFTTISNIMKTKHDTAKNAINNVR
jgi:arginine decarboxylase-like protein